jgi:hypothetical protein
VGAAFRAGPDTESYHEKIRHSCGELCVCGAVWILEGDPRWSRRERPQWTLLGIGCSLSTPRRTAGSRLGRGRRGGHPSRADTQQRRRAAPMAAKLSLWMRRRRQIRRQVPTFPCARTSHCPHVSPSNLRERSRRVISTEGSSRAATFLVGKRFATCLLMVGALADLTLATTGSVHAVESSRVAAVAPAGSSSAVRATAPPMPVRQPSRPTEPSSGRHPPRRRRGRSRPRRHRAGSRSLRPRPVRASITGRSTAPCWAPSLTVPASGCPAPAGIGRACLGLVVPRRHLRLGSRGSVAGRAAHWPRWRWRTTGYGMSLMSPASCATLA